MTGFDFSADVQRTLRAAREEAAELGSKSVGTEHILLAFERLRSPGISSVLDRLAIPNGPIRRHVSRGGGGWWRKNVETTELCYQRGAKRAIEHAMLEARGLGRTTVTSDDLLLGVLIVAGRGARVLRRSGVDVIAERKSLRRALAKGEAPTVA